MEAGALREVVSDAGAPARRGRIGSREPVRRSGAARGNDHRLAGDVRLSPTPGPIHEAVGDDVRSLSSPVCRGIMRLLTSSPAMRTAVKPFELIFGGHLFWVRLVAALGKW